MTLDSILILFLSLALAVAILLVHHERREKAATKDLLLRTLNSIHREGAPSNEAKSRPPK